jgi:hypothetical protein
LNSPIVEGAPHRVERSISLNAKAQTYSPVNTLLENSGDRNCNQRESPPVPLTSETAQLDSKRLDECVSEAPQNVDSYAIELVMLARQTE